MTKWKSMKLNFHDSITRYIQNLCQNLIYIQSIMTLIDAFCTGLYHPGIMLLGQLIEVTINEIIFLYMTM